jgi:RNA 2',3'-cyclic 3'-phosphodiesterase
MPARTHRSAVAVLPPEGVWEPIQAIRRQYDRQVHRWMPHINLLYPFYPHPLVPAAAEAVAKVTAALAPFRLTLAEFRSFRHPSGRCTLWLAPEPAEALRRLQSALQRQFPDCDEQSRFPAGFTPHLSVGQFASAAECEGVRAQLQASWPALPFDVTDVALLHRGGDAPFVVGRRVALAGP